MVNPGRHGLQPGPFGERHHLLRLGGGGKIDLGDGKPEQGVAHGAADGARLDAVAIQRIEHGKRRRPLQPLCAGKRWSLGAALNILRDHSSSRPLNRWCRA